jgi:hypothetical protein
MVKSRNKSSRHFPSGTIANLLPQRIGNATLGISADSLPRYQTRHQFDYVEAGKKRKRKITNRKAGRNDLYDWNDIELFVFQTLNEHEDFDDPKNQISGWGCQADLLRLVADYIKKVHPKDAKSLLSMKNPERSSTLKDKIPPMVTAWRKKQKKAKTGR